MYKKITHNIVEEHFDHPMASQIRSGLHPLPYDPAHPDAPYTYDPMYPMPRPMALSMTAQSRFRSESRKLWSNFLWRTRATMVGAMDALPDASVVAAQLDTDITRIGDVVKSFVGETIANEFTNHLRNITTTVVDIGKAVKVGKDITPLKIAVAMHIDAMAEQLSKLIPSAWPASAVKDIWTKLTDSWIQQAKVRNAKDWSADLAAMDSAHDIMLAPYDGPINIPAGFSDIFANGIIKQFPDKFKG